MSKKSIVLLFVLLILTLSIKPANAQVTTGTITVVVIDESQAVVPRATVTVIRNETNSSQSVTTNESGNYTLDLPAGLYRVEVKLAGFKKAVLPEVVVNEGARNQLIVPLESGPVTESYIVYALQLPDDATVGSSIDHDVIPRLPRNSVRLDMFILLFPGAIPSVPGSHLYLRGGFHAGMDEHYNTHLLGGLYNNDPVIRAPAYLPPVYAIDEFRVQPAGGSAQYGKNAGAIVAVTTRSGTNQIRGSVWEFLRNDHLDARNYFALRNSPRPTFIRNQFGATLGGPIRKERTFFFAAFEGLRLKEGISRLATVPTARMRMGDLSELGVASVPLNEINPTAFEAIQAFPLPNLTGTVGNRIETATRIENANNFSIKVDHALSAHTSLAVRVGSETADVLDPFRNELAGGVNLSGFGQTADRARRNVGLSVTTDLGIGVNEFRAGYNRVSQPVVPLNRGTPLQMPLMGFEEAFPSFSIKGLFDTLGSGGESRRAVNVYNYNDSLSFDLDNHRMKAGVDIVRYLFNAYAVQPNSFTFDGSRTGNALADFLRGLPATSISSDGSPGGNISKTELAWYVQDDWKATRRLTLSYGLRWEYYGRIQERVNKQSLWLPECNCMAVAGVDLPDQLVDNDFNNFAPRFGLVFRPASGRRTVIRASAGIFYDNDMRHNAELIGNPPFFRTDVFLAFLNPALSLDNPFPNNAVFPSLRPITLDRKYRDTYAEVWTLGVQDEIGAGILLDLTYVGNHVLKMRRVRNIDQPINGVLPHPGFQQIFLFEQAGSSNFNSLEARVERKVRTGLFFMSSYTWSHAIDDRPGSGVWFPQNNYDMRAERADSDYDVRHRWVLSGAWDLPIGPGRRWGGGLSGIGKEALTGWTVSAINTVQSGRPLNVVLAGNPSGSGLPVDRPNAVYGVDWRPADQRPDNWINPAAFSVPAPGTFGTLGRNALRGPGFSNLDLALAKAHPISDTARIQIRLEVFNATNHPNFNLPTNPSLLAAVLPIPVPAPGATSFGVISSTASSERQIQFGLRLEY
ncbi:MAG TPA: carboxypeptidase regulatory-like domain-containing protein [Terriglobia bacterium]|nr:carboxypeptidase regulatory-like domain-containing protein [Terriglobia bacterium]